MDALIVVHYEWQSVWTFKELHVALFELSLILAICLTALCRFDDYLHIAFLIKQSKCSQFFYDKFTSKLLYGIEDFKARKLHLHRNKRLSMIVVVEIPSFFLSSRFEFLQIARLSCRYLYAKYGAFLINDSVLLSRRWSFVRRRLAETSTRREGQWPNSTDLDIDE